MKHLICSSSSTTMNSETPMCLSGFWNDKANASLGSELPLSSQSDNVPAKAA